jgi:tagaturonate reductase
VVRLNRQLIESDFKFPHDVSMGTLAEMPERIIQFGEGNFLRAFVDWMVNEANQAGLFNGKIVVVQPIEPGRVSALNEQDGLYTVWLRGKHKGEKVERKNLVTAVSRGINPYTHWREFLLCAASPDLRFMISNTTEVGIAYAPTERPGDRCPASFPAKVTAFLHERYRHFHGSAEGGMVIIACELIDRNGDRLKEIVLRHAAEWGLGIEFQEWLKESNYFLNSLVDRIVTGYPRDEIQEITAKLGYQDDLLVAGEPFHLWVIEGDERFREELPLAQGGLDVIWTRDVQPYRTRKVRVLNGIHTVSVLAAFLYGKDTVQECLQDPVLGTYMRKAIFAEIVPTLDLPQDELLDFAETTLERFRNPYLIDSLLRISLYSVSKFKLRVVPSVLEYVKRNHRLPLILTFSLAALIAFYRGTEIKEGILLGDRKGQPYPIRDQKDVLEFFAQAWKECTHTGDLQRLCRCVLAQEEFWGQDLNQVPGMTAATAANLSEIMTWGIKGPLSALVA